jgi:hypothetical protein
MLFEMTTNECRTLLERSSASSILRSKSSFPWTASVQRISVAMVSSMRDSARILLLGNLLIASRRVLQYTIQNVERTRMRDSSSWSRSCCASIFVFSSYGMRQRGAVVWIGRNGGGDGEVGISRYQATSHPQIQPRLRYDPQVLEYNHEIVDSSRLAFLRCSMSEETSRLRNVWHC